MSRSKRLTTEQGSISHQQSEPVFALNNNAADSNKPTRQVSVPNASMNAVQMSIQVGSTPMQQQQQPQLQQQPQRQPMAQPQQPQMQIQHQTPVILFVF